MSEIPVGSPPVPPGRHAAPGGWYPDPVNPAQERYWDGWQWSRNTRPRESWTPGSAPHAARPVAPRAAPYAGVIRPASARTADGVPLAGWWWRVLAVVIDNVIVSTLSAIVLAPIYIRLVRAMSEALAAVVRAARAGQPAPPLAPTDLISGSDQLLITLVTVALQLIYVVAFLRWKAATPGKLVCRLRVVPVDQGLSRARLPWPTVLLRAAIWVLPGALNWLVAFKAVDGLFPLWHPKRQALHDIAARTQVVALR